MNMYIEHKSDYVMSQGLMSFNLYLLYKVLAKISRIVSLKLCQAFFENCTLLIIILIFIQRWTEDHRN